LIATLSASNVVRTLEPAAATEVVPRTRLSDAP